MNSSFQTLSAAVVAAIVSAQALAAPCGRKIIGIGHEFYERHAAEALAAGGEFRATPLDGIALPMFVRPEKGGAAERSATLMDATNCWSYASLAGEIADFRKLPEATGLTDNFIYAFRHPSRRISWTDDARWELIAANLRVLARACRAAGLRGFVIDPEDYRKQDQFGWRPDESSYEEAAGRVRSRAAQLFRGVFEDYPDITLIAYWFFSMDRNLGLTRDLHAAARDRGSLWSAFVNGILDVAPASARLVDANENYRYRARFNDFPLAAAQIRRCFDLAAPENRAKCRQLMDVGFGLWLGMYLKDEDRPRTKDLDKWSFEDPVPSRCGRLVENLSQALAASDSYLWFYTASEQLAWVHWPKGAVAQWPTWGERHPQLLEAMRLAKDPDGWMAERLPDLEHDGRLVNLIPANRREPSDVLGAKGKCEYRTYSVADVKPDEVYGCRVRVSGEGAHVAAYWNAKGLKRRPNMVPPVTIPFKERFAGAPRTVTGCVIVPPGVDRLDVAVRALPSKSGVRVEQVEVWKLVSFAEDSEK